MEAGLTQKEPPTEAGSTLTGDPAKAGSGMIPPYNTAMALPTCGKAPYSGADRSGSSGWNLDPSAIESLFHFL